MGIGSGYYDQLNTGLVSETRRDVEGQGGCDLPPHCLSVGHSPSGVLAPEPRALLPRIFRFFSAVSSGGLL